MQTKTNTHLITLLAGVFSCKLQKVEETAGRTVRGTERSKVKKTTQLIIAYFFPSPIKDAEGNCCKQTHDAKKHGPPNCANRQLCPPGVGEALVSGICRAGWREGTEARSSGDLGHRQLRKA